MRNNNEIAAMALARSADLKRKRKKRIITGGTVLIACSLVIAFASGITFFLTPEPGGSGKSYAAEASTALFGDSAIGGYVLIGIASFFTGVIVTLICKHWIQKHQ